MSLELLLKWVTGRNVALLLGGLLLLWYLELNQEAPRRLYEQWRYPPQGGAARTAAAIEADLERKESLRLRALHRSVSRDISRAKERGSKVEGLQRLADAVLKLDMPGYRQIGMEKLNQVRLRIPQNEAVRAVSPEDDQVVIPPDVRGRAKRRRR